MNNTTPEITVGLAVYNGEKHLREAIDSILAQTFSDFQLLISDNASVDATQQICEEYARKDKRIKYLRQQSNIGAPRNWNSVFRASNSKYFKWASGNDICHPEMLAQCRAVLDKRPDVVLCYPRTKIIDENGNIIEEYDDVLHLEETDPAERFRRLVSGIGLNNAQNGLIRSEVLRRTALERKYHRGDITLMAELSLHGKFFELPEYLFFRRMGKATTVKYRTKEELKHFYNPGRKRFYIPYWQYCLGLFRVVWRSPIGFGEKLRLQPYLGKNLYWGRERLWQEITSIFNGTN